MHAARDEHPIRARRHRLAASAVLVLAVVLSGCATATGAAPTPVPSQPSPSGTPQAAQPVSGTGPTAAFPAGAALPIPAGAHSLTVDFACTGGGRYEVELGDSMMLGQSPLRGTCDGTHQLAWPLTARTQGVLHVTVPGGVAWAATPHFSSDEFQADAGLTADCKAFSAVYSALTNADEGFTQYKAFGADEWTTRVDQAATDLATAAKASTPALRAQFASLLAIVSAPSRSVGSVLAGTGDPIAQISRACDTNQTPVVVTAEFGG